MHYSSLSGEDLKCRLDNVMLLKGRTIALKVHKNENFFDFDFEFCTISLLVMSKY